MRSQAINALDYSRPQVKSNPLGSKVETAMPTDKTIKVTAKLVELFPESVSESPWLLRLMVIRDDVEYELRNLALKPDDGAEEIWRCTYFIRRLSTSLMEAESIFASEVGKFAKKAGDPEVSKLSPRLREAMTVARNAAALLKPIRDAVGAHIRPQNVDPRGESVEARVLRNFPNLSGTGLLSPDVLHETTFREFTTIAPVLAWPDVNDGTMHETRHIELRDALVRTAANVLYCIDALLILHWSRLGLLKLEDGHAIAIIDAKTGKKQILVKGK